VALKTQKIDAARPANAPLRTAWLRPKQTDLVPGKGQFCSRFHHPLSYCCPTTIFVDPRTDTDIISAQHFWTGGLETAGPDCYDAVAIARAAGFRMLVMSRIRHAAIVPNHNAQARFAFAERWRRRSACSRGIILAYTWIVTAGQ
jgi:hypothetical protein